MTADYNVRGFHKRPKMEVSDICYVQILLTASLGRKEQKSVNQFLHNWQYT